MDWSSFVQLTKPTSIALLRRPLHSAGEAAKLRDELGPELVDLIARLTVYDAIILDSAVAEICPNPLGREVAPLIPVAFPSSVYEDASSATLRSL